ncbi:MAG TPA: FHA domain-containing protein [Kofleriaceae bacterium]|jgi:pSer/pThr/pTyr-binding forkhead associated (FHA) protein
MVELPPTPENSDAPEGWSGPDPITYLKRFDYPTWFELPRETKRFRLGSSLDRTVCDLHLSVSGVSQVHCIFERRSGQLRVIDQASINGIVVDGYRSLPEGWLSPGKRVTVRPVTLLAYNDEMYRERPLIAQITGTDPRLMPSGELRNDPLVGATVDNLMARATTPGMGYLITGDIGCEQEELARALHAISLRRNRAPVLCERLPELREEQKALLQKAEDSTLIIALPDDHAVVDRAFRAMLASTDYRVTVMLLASQSVVAERLLPELTRTMEVIALRPLAHRLSDVEPLFDEIMDKYLSKLQLSMLPDRDQVAIRRYNWDSNYKHVGNLAELRRFVAEYAAVRQHGSIDRAAKALELDRDRLRYHFQKIGIR